MGLSRIKLEGKQFGRWTVGKYLGFTNNAMYECTCKCGTVKPVSAGTLKNGVSSSCGCLHKEVVSKTSVYPKKMNKTWSLYKKDFLHLTVQW